MQQKASCGEALIALLSDYGFEVVFGIPGTHAVELYRGLGNSGLRHILARHEQGAAFMADGYARVSGKPGLCFLITGPGLTNASTGIAQAYSDSIPLLVITPVNETWSIGKGFGRLHELRNQLDITRSITAINGTVTSVEELPDLVNQAMDMFVSKRPRPAHIQIPLDICPMPVDIPWSPRPLPPKKGSEKREISAAVALLRNARFPVIIAGGGSIGCSRDLYKLAEILSAPVVTTIAAKGVFPSSHPLNLGSTLSRPETQLFVSDADVVLTLGSELAQTDIGNDEFKIEGTHIRVDIDTQVLQDDYGADLAINADVSHTVKALVEQLEVSTDSASLNERIRSIAALHINMKSSLTAIQKAHLRCLEQIRNAIPQDGIVAGDMAQVVYTANRFMPFEQPGCYLHPVGYGALGYALPAAMGAKIAAPDRVVIALAGDYGFMFSAQDMLTAVEEKINIIVVIWNNSGLSQICDDMISLGVIPTGVDATGPDFVKMAESFGWSAQHVDNPDLLGNALTTAIAQQKPTLIEVDEDSFL